LQLARGSIPAGTSVQVPVALAQDWQLDPQALSQQVLSTQLPEPHSEGDAHAAPFAFLPVVQEWSLVQ
jgi:hypothetical protein